MPYIHSTAQQTTTYVYVLKYILHYNEHLCVDGAVFTMENITGNIYYHQTTLKVIAYTNNCQAIQRDERLFH